MAGLTSYHDPCPGPLIIFVCVIVCVCNVGRSYLSDCLLQSAVIMSPVIGDYHHCCLPLISCDRFQSLTEGRVYAVTAVRRLKVYAVYARSPAVCPMFSSPGFQTYSNIVASRASPISWHSTVIYWVWSPKQWLVLVIKYLTGKTHTHSHIYLAARVPPPV